MKEIILKNRRNLREHILVLACVIACFAANAAESFTVHAPSRVQEGAKFQVTFTLRNAEGSNFTAPEVTGATLMFGPARSTSYSTSVVNGHATSSSSQEYTMTYKATQAGTCRVGAASINVGGKTLTTRPLNITIAAGPAGGGSQQQQQPNMPPQPSTSGSPRFDDPFSQSSDRKVTNNDLFIRIELSKPHVYEQQAVVCNIKLYTKYQISEFMVTKQPSFDGFLIEEVPMEPSLNNVETFNGQQYQVAILKRCILYPQQAGKLTITSGNYDVSVVQFDAYSSIFGSLLQPIEKKLKVQSNSATVNILPLPEPKPADFTGAVGQFDVNTTLTPTKLKSFAQGNYRYVITGTGNIKYIRAPEIAFPDQFDVYDAESDVKINTGGGDMSGRVTFTYPFSPQYAGDFEIPASHFVYFDPDRGQYDSIAVPARKIHVDKGEGTQSNHYRMRNLDIRPIASGDLGLKRGRSFLIDKALYWLAFLLPLLALIAAIVVYRKQVKRNADVVAVRTRKAGKVAARRLKSARALAMQGKVSPFYAELLNATWGYLSDKLSIPQSDLNRETVQTEMSNRGVPAEKVEQTIALIDKCEFAQYAPQLADGNLNDALAQAEKVINDLEDVKLKKTPSA